MPRQSQRTNQGVLPVRFRDEDEFATMKSKDKKLKRKMDKKKKNEAGSVRGGEVPDSPAIVQAPPTTSTSPTVTLPSSPTPPTSSIAWQTVERKVPPGADRPITLSGRFYPFNRWNLLRPGPIYAILKVLSTYFILSDTLKLLHLEKYEIIELERLLQPDMRMKVAEIHNEEIVYAKRILLANIECEKLTGDLCRRLDKFERVSTCLREIESGMFDLPKDESGVVECEAAGEEEDVVVL